MPPQADLPPPRLRPYANLTVGIPVETYPSERRLALTPANASLLRSKGISRVLFSRGAGEAAQFLDSAFGAAGATIASQEEVWRDSDVILKVRPPSEEEVRAMKKGQTLVSFLYPALNRPLVESLAARGVDVLAMDMIPRISRAQVFDALR